MEIPSPGARTTGCISRAPGAPALARTGSKYMTRRRKPPSRSWRTVLNTHVAALASIDFFDVPTASFAVLSVVIVVRHGRRPGIEAMAPNRRI